MGYSLEIYAKAQQILDERRSASKIEFDKRNKEVEEKIDGISELKAELALSCKTLARSVFSGYNIQETERAKESSLKARRIIREKLKENGFPEDYLDEHYTCEKCKDTGYTNGKECECLKKLLKDISVRSLCDHSVSDKSTFETFDLSMYPQIPNGKTGIVPREKMAEILRFCKSYAEVFSKNSGNIFMSGKTRLGKTHLSLSIANEVIKKGFDVIYGPAEEIFGKIEKEHFTGKNEGYLDRVLGCDLLIIDDLGTEFESKFNLSQIYNIINSRNNFGLPTIISTNLTGAELQERYKERVMSRLIGEYDCLVFVGDDIRQKKKFG
ncbi:MAG: ATP-binding protein [Oscillospiraceae bacterium]